MSDKKGGRSVPLPAYTAIELIEAGFKVSRIGAGPNYLIEGMGRELVIHVDALAKENFTTIARSVLHGIR